MDKELRKEVKRIIADLFTSNSSLTHTDDWRKMRTAAEMLQTLLSLVDDLECSQDTVPVAPNRRKKCGPQSS